MPTTTSRIQSKPIKQSSKIKNAKTRSQIKEVKEQDKRELGSIKEELFIQAQKKLPELLIEKVGNIIEEVSKYCEEEQKGLIDAQIAPLIANRTTTFYVQASYSVDELYIVFNEFVRMISEINKKVKFVPSLKKFCAFAGITSSTYENYLVDFDEDKRNVARMIDDYITDVQLTSAQNGEIREITTIYRTKAEHKMVEAQSPIVMEYRKTLDFDEVKKKLESLGRFKEID